MKVLAGMIVYNRMDNVKLWMSAWDNADKQYDTDLVVVHNHDNAQPDDYEKQTICQYGPTYYYPRKNEGQDVGALRDTIQLFKAQQYDVLFWCTDDNIPVNKSFLSHFIDPFVTDDKVGIVANHYVRSDFYPNWPGGVPSHVRTCCFAVRKDVALNLQFPAPLITKWHCWDFEWHDKRMNMTAQIRRMKYTIRTAHDDVSRCWTTCNDYVWDLGYLNTANKDARCRKDCWQAYNAQFVGEEHDWNSYEIQKA